MNKQLLNFHILLFFVLGISFFFHKCSIDNTDHLTFLYAINASIAILVYWIVFLLRNNNKGYLGYYFLLGTFIKFFIFFIFVLPIFKDDNIVSRTEFFTFFIPYFLSLMVETKSLISLLNSEEN
jgi:hypothetical protein|tara:strand:+ start:281 stop:652 length:372 start_codon:yes stop_codon:yes gene_type:complete